MANPTASDDRDPAPGARDALAATSRLQAQAADPAASVWVSANAGTGKTHVLTQRVLRLLLSGTAPERILCLTYTKAAAAEMSKRVFDTLARWVGLGGRELTSELNRLTGSAPYPAESDLARTLFTRAIETPGGFKVQTIHAFCERLLQRFPLEAGVAPGFQILDDATGKTLIREAIDATLQVATGNREADLGHALTTAIRYAADDQFDAVLSQAITQRELLDALIRANRSGGDLDEAGDPFAFARPLLCGAFGVRADADVAAVRSEMSAVIDESSLIRLAGALSGGLKTDAELGGVLREASRASGQQRVEALARYFSTTSGGARQRLMTKTVKDEHPDLDLLATRAQGRFQALDAELRGLEVVEATIALYRLASAVLQRYRDAKAARAALDFDDLIVKTASLLREPEGAAWVLYKLDGGLDHILVDEAQDTSPAQWQVIEAIAAEFFADRGAGARTGPRTVFAVGDEKQSIYSFQGAAPEMFAAMGARFKARAEATGMPWRPTALTLSFRTVAPILATVDEVFADPVRTPGLGTGGSETIRHLVKRTGHAGLVEIWPVELPEDKVETDAWSPLEETTPSSPVSRLANRIAATIRGWLDAGEWLASEGRRLRAGDILILVRKREPAAGAIVAALKRAKIAVAGADRMALAQQIGVQDLIALGDFLTLPEDDLSLATVLKSPLFGLDDDDLTALAHGRKGTLWQALLQAGKTTVRFGDAGNLLKRWRKEADFKPPFEFYSAVLDHDGGRSRLLERLGAEAADGIDELLNLALSYDDEAPPSMTGFLTWLRCDDRTIKRDMEQGRDEVRVLTVHGAKGLEAPVVFLPDTCSTASRPASGLLSIADVDLPSGMPPLAVWPVKGASSLAPIAAARAGLKAREDEERNRLLYVALTRPRDRLYVAGAQTRANRPEGCWYDLVLQALGPHLQKVELADGSVVQRLNAEQTVPAEPRTNHLARDDAAAARPAWMSRPAPRETQPAIPVAPSRMAPYDFDDTGEPISRTLVSGADAGGTGMKSESTSPRPGIGGRFLRGELTHALLEHLPSLPPQARPAAARAFLDRRGGGLPAGVRRQIVTETLAVLEHPVFAPLFSLQSLAEVPVVAELGHPSGKGPALKLNGQIDRLVDTGSEILIVDYKTNRAAPGHVNEVPEAYVLQLAAYRSALSVIFPGRWVRAALLWTETPSLMEIPEEWLDAHSSRLWEYGTPKLDALGLGT